jgi:hypothetical protein
MEDCINNKMHPGIKHPAAMKGVPALPSIPCEQWPHQKVSVNLL